MLNFSQKWKKWNLNCADILFFTYQVEKEQKSDNILCEQLIKQWEIYPLLVKE